jgi:GDPmannose 4,6-dehydratase
MIQILTKTSQPDDYVMATGEAHSVREFCEAAFAHVGLDYRDYVIIDPRFYRPAEVDVLLGDYSKIKKAIGWEPTVTFKELVVRMVNHDMHLMAAGL